MTIGEERFADFFANTPVATTPLSTEPMLVLQGGLTKQTPALNLGAATAVFYVSPSGNDANNGRSTASAWQTIAKVNASTFAPGNVILFQGGQTFSGAIVCPSSGASGAPITFGSYGGGQATISSGTSNGFTSTSQAGIVVRDLIFTGSASTNHGVLFTNGLAGNVHLQNIQAINLNVSGYGLNGIYVTGTNGSAGYDDVLIQGCNVSSCCSVANSGNGTAGIFVNSPAGYGLLANAVSFNNVIVDNCVVSSCLGTTDISWTGSGIVLSEVNHGIIRSSKAISNGSGSNSSTGGPVGIWCFDSTSISIIDCRSISNSTANHLDGGGFDLDGGCVDCEINDCYSEGNAGPGFQIVSYNDGKVTGNDKLRIINCVSVGDGIGASNAAPYAFNIANNNAVTNVRLVGCSTSFTVTGGAALAALGSNQAATTGEVIDCNLAVAGSISLLFGNFTGIILVGLLYPSAISSVGFSGQFEGYYARLNSDIQNRVTAALNGSDLGFFGLGPGSNSNVDCALFRYGTSILGLGGDPYGGLSHPAGWQVYNSIDTTGNPTNYERAVFDWTTTSNVLTIGTQKGGMGSPRNIQFVAGNANVLDYGITTAGVWSTAAGGTFQTAYFQSIAAAGGFTGYYLKLNGDSTQRGIFALDVNNNATFIFGVGIAGDSGLASMGTRTVAVVPGQALGANPCAFQVYNSNDVSSGTPTNYERAVFDWTTTSNVLTIGTQKGGSGSSRNIQFVAGNANVLDWNITAGNTWSAGAPSALFSFQAAYFGAIGTSGNVPGLYLRIDTDNIASTRLGAILDGSNNPVIQFGPGGASSTPADTGISRVAPVSSVPTVAFGNATSGDASATIKAKTKAGAPTTSDVPAGTWVLIRDTTNATTKLYYNNAGTLQTVALV